MGKTIFVAFLIFKLGCLTILGQELYPVRGTVYVREGKAVKVNLSISKEGTEKRVPVDVNGDFVTYLTWNGVFQFRFSKPGYISKIISFSTQLPEEVDKSNIFPYEILVELFPTFPEVDTAFFKRPVAKIKYSKEDNDFVYDLDYQLIIQRKMKQIKTQYEAWKKNIVAKPKSSRAALLKEREESAIRYQKSVEIKQKGAALSTSTKVPSKSIKSIVKEERPFDFPPLQDSYPEGKSIEIHELKGKVITRVIIKNGKYQKIFYKVKHNWGGLYYFVQESPSHYRNISKYNFEKATKI
ncbi:hypothetical protein [Saccharicrinis fermentans]|uniref:Carboxypeptidase regulatory-like domain-containing protein n=1 Tax=Saccharicrinis fermentans DSM 9555 = JCM 21142 TaxID=869213 RepID=W7Y740_9BACT|nr:hypothetical protein [Saccharicrinis fermentans]GAF03493.1 hypothetical protein JCM21142_52170 [Saccharicrinis fermentans DSM 9555 = JCM 21142]